MSPPKAVHSSATNRHHANAGSHHHSTKKTGNGARSQRQTALTQNATTTNNATNAAPPAASYYEQNSSGDDSYAAGGGFISDMDERDSAFDGAMEYEEEDGRGLLGQDFDNGSDVAVDHKEDKKEKRAREFQDRLRKLELEFEENKQTIFDYQMARYKEEMDAILNGAHPDFHDRIVDLEEARDAAIRNAELFRDYQFACAEETFEQETLKAEDDYLGEREGLREKMLATIENKRQALREDKENLDITNDFALESTVRPHHATRKLRKRGQESEIGTKSTKRKPTQPPAAKWAAPESDALEDLGMIRKVVSSGNVKKTTNVKKK